MKRREKIPIRIYLEPEQEKIINHLSRTSGRSKAAIVRLCISQFIDNLLPEKDPALDIIGPGDAQKGDISQNHDDYLTSFKK